MSQTSCGVGSQLPNKANVFQFLANSINNLEHDMSHSVSLHAEELKNKFVDFIPLEHADPTDILEEKIAAIVTDFVARILLSISESISRLRSSVFEYNPTIESILVRPTSNHPAQESIIVDVSEGVLTNNEVHFEGDAELPMSFADELAGNYSILIFCIYTKI